MANWQPDLDLGSEENEKFNKLTEELVALLSAAAFRWRLDAFLEGRL